MATVFSTRDLGKLRRGGAILSQAIRQVAQAVRPGVTTLDLDRLAEVTIRQQGGEPAFKGYRGFPATLCVSVNDEVVHGLPRADRRLKVGDVVGLDLGVRYAGFATDLAVTVPVGPVSGQARDLIETARQALDEGIKQVKLETPVGTLGATIQAFVEQRGYSVIRDLVGHGIGRELHEEPKIPNYGKRGQGPRLKERTAIAIEPMITTGRHQVSIDDDGWTIRTKDGSLAAHFEQTVLVLPNGYEIITPYGQGFGD